MELYDELNTILDDVADKARCWPGCISIYAIELSKTITTLRDKKECESNPITQRNYLSLEIYPSHKDAVEWLLEVYDWVISVYNTTIKKPIKYTLRKKTEPYPKDDHNTKLKRLLEKYKPIITQYEKNSYSDFHCRFSLNRK